MNFIPRLKLFLSMCIFLFSTNNVLAQSEKFRVVAYYGGSPTLADSFPVEKLTHIIFSFAHLKGNELHINNARDSATINELIKLKSRNPQLKVLISLGGWSGCATCSDVFSSKKGRKDFANSARQLCNYFNTDGIDLDWEYPAIAGFPGHLYQAADKENFTKLVKRLRKTLGTKREITFAAGGFKQYIDSSIEWKKVMKRVNFVNLMSYDLVNGYASVTGHHTALYSTHQQFESTDQAVNQLINLHVRKDKIVIGAAFYGKVWENVPDTADGLYQNGKYIGNIIFRNFDSQMSADSGFTYHWDSVAQAPFSYNAQKKLFVTYDDKKSITLKTKYVLDNGLGGIMFWELAYDAFSNGLLEAIDEVRKNGQEQK
jgi:chitinase